MDPITALIYVHAAAGGVALAAGGVSLLVHKGGGAHRRAGRVFYYAMLGSALLSLVIAVLPGHYSPFLFSIGIFTAYLLVSGYRSLRYKQATVLLVRDRALAYFIVLVGLAMVLAPPVLAGGFEPVLLTFGSIAVFLGLRDLSHFRDPVGLREKWLRLHLAKMTAAYTAAVTAFLVVNESLPGLWNWFAPLAVGGGVIAYWIRRTRERVSPGAEVS